MPEDLLCNSACLSTKANFNQFIPLSMTEKYKSPLSMTLTEKYKSSTRVIHTAVD